MKITFHYTFLLVAISFILTGYFSNLIIFTSIILIHELGHYHAAKINNLKVDKIIIYPYGGITKINTPVNTKIKKELIVAISGILYQLIYFFLIYILLCVWKKINLSLDIAIKNPDLVMWGRENEEGVSKVEKIRIGLLVGGYSIPAIPTQSTENEGRVGRAGMPYPPTFVAFNPYNWLLTHPPPAICFAYLLKKWTYNIITQYSGWTQN